MNLKPGRHILGLVIVAAGAALNAQMLVDWMRHGTV
ncbi:hypothetical protein FHS28_002351 [Roseateles terrae]|uniref:Transposase n=1 Tax=Roseateles terrae TaxID=431060 RepID=A0ABR6GS70_9BURK|nr:hypothetical protein [Roseateles terrae]